MANGNRNRGQTIWPDVSRVTTESPQTYCVWRECFRPRFAPDTPVCIRHAIEIARRLNEEILAVPPDDADGPHPGQESPPGFVYYLMLSPTTVKIGTTRNLVKRLSALRTDLQYVVGLEVGGFDLETRRHRQFFQERIGRREDFRLSDGLTQHIASLQPSRDELIKIASA